MKYKKLLFSGLVLFVAVLSCNCCFAKVSVRPSRVEALVPASKGFEEKFFIKNIGDQPTKVNIHWTDRTKNPLIKDWLVLPDKQISIQPGEEKEVAYKVNIPKDAAGEYNAWFVVSDAKGPEIKMGASIAVRTSIPIYIIVKGTEKYDFEIQNFNAWIKPSFSSFNIILRNTGNVHIRPTGKVKISALDSTQVYEMPFNEVGWGIIEGQNHEYVTKLPDEKILPDGKYKAEFTVKAGTDNKFKEISDEVLFTVNKNKTQIIDKAEQKK